MRKVLSKVVYELTLKKKKKRPAAILTIDWSGELGGGVGWELLQGQG